MKALLLAGLLLLASGWARAAFPPGEEFSPGWKFEGKALHFTRASLFDHIDGGAELFLEFGFVTLDLQRYRRGGTLLTLEVYRMASTAGALGIYLSLCGTETPTRRVEARSSCDPSQLLAVRGNVLVIVDNFSGGGDLVPEMAALANAAFRDVPSAPDEPVFDRLPREGLVPGSLRLVAGPLSLRSLFLFGEGDILSLRGEIFGCAGTFSTNGGTYTHLVVPYPDEGAAEAAYSHLVHHLDPAVEVQARGEKGFTFRDYKGTWGSVTLEGSLLELLTDCPTPRRLRSDRAPQRRR